MILREHRDGQLLITQPDHAALAARIMEQWGPGLAGSPRRPDILHAIASHDNGWLDVDAAPIVDRATGTVLDFIHVSDDIRRGVWPRSVALLNTRPYAAALVAQHAVHIFTRYRGDDDWTPFFAQMEALRDEQLGRAGAVALETLVHEYSYLRLADLLSLSFCNAWTEAQGQDHGYAIRFDGARVTMCRARGQESAWLKGAAHLADDPFGGKEVSLEVPGRLLPRAPFTSADEAHAAWTSAPRLSVTGLLAVTAVC